MSRAAINVQIRRVRDTLRIQASAEQAECAHIAVMQWPCGDGGSLRICVACGVEEYGSVRTTGKLCDRPDRTVMVTRDSEAFQKLRLEL